jgi:hypothetical protein
MFLTDPERAAVRPGAAIRVPPIERSIHMWVPPRTDRLFRARSHTVHRSRSVITVSAVPNSQVRTVLTRPLFHTLNHGVN